MLGTDYHRRFPKRSMAARLLVSAGALIVMGIVLARLYFGGWHNPPMEFAVWIPTPIGAGILASWVVWNTIFHDVDMNDGPQWVALSGAVFAAVMLAVALIVG